MATVQSKIERSLRLINAIEEGETPGTEILNDSLEALNDMLNDWVDHGVKVDIGELSLSDEMPADPGDARAIVYNLAVELSPEFGRDPLPTIAIRATELYSRLETKYADVKELDMPFELEHNEHLNTGPNVWYNFDS